MGTVLSGTEASTSAMPGSAWMSVTRYLARAGPILPREGRAVNRGLNALLFGGGFDLASFGGVAAPRFEGVGVDDVEPYALGLRDLGGFGRVGTACLAYQVFDGGEDEFGVGGVGG
jgi:hypothetical protein